jgi:hypothetical protein
VNGDDVDAAGGGGGDTVFNGLGDVVHLRYYVAIATMGQRITEPGRRRLAGWMILFRQRP